MTVKPTETITEWLPFNAGDHLSRRKPAPQRNLPRFESIRGGVMERRFGGLLQTGLASPEHEAFVARLTQSE